MRLSKFLKVMGTVTILALTYIHMQMQIVDLAYRGNRKERQIEKLIEENGSATYQILMLKSVNRLGTAMFEKDSGMQFADAADVIRVAAPEEFLTENQPRGQAKLARRTNSLLSLLSFGVEAEAETAE